jgi:hypothetical protein
MTNNFLRIALITSTLTTILAMNIAEAGDALNVTSIGNGCAGIVGCSSIAAGQPDSWFVNGTATATSLNTGGNTATGVGNFDAATRINGGTNEVNSSNPALIISGQNGSSAINTTVGLYPQIPSGTGVLITGAGSNGGPDVYIASQNGKSAISITNDGVNIISPAGTNGSPINLNSANNLGNAGAYTSGNITNNIGNGDPNSSATINNTIGNSYAGSGGTINNSFGGGTGTSTNSVGSVTGGGSSTNYFGSTGTNGNSGTATNNIGTGYGASTNNFGNTNLSTTNSMNAGNTSSFMGNGVSTTSVQPTEGGPGRSILGGYTSANSGTVLRGATGTYASVNANGKIELNTNQVAPESSTSMTLTNGYGNVHGIVVNERQTTISGGTSSSSMTLNDYGATFSNSANGRPIQVHGVADGTSNFDAVNLQQLDAVKLGIAGVAAMNNIPALAIDKNFSVGVGVGGFDSKQSFALGANARVNDYLVIKASASHGINANDSNVNTTTWGLGGALSW